MAQVRPKFSETQRLTGIALFSALALAINFSHFSLPFPLAGYLLLDFWEIPIVVALLFFGLSAGITVSLVNLVVLLAIQQGSLPSGPFYNVAATLAMFAGIIAGHKIMYRMNRNYLEIIAAATALGIITRCAVMTVVNAIVLPLPPPLGFSLLPSYIPATLLVVGAFNAFVALYTIVVAYTITKALLPRYHFRLAFPLQKAPGSVSSATSSQT